MFHSWSSRHWRETVERRINCYTDPDAVASENYDLGFEPEAAKMDVPLAELAKLHLPDPNAGNSLPRELLTVVGIGLLLTTMIVFLVHFALRK